MPNPVRELLTLLDKWRVPERGSHLRVRGDGSRDVASHEFWSNVSPALRLLVEAESIVDGMEADGVPVSAYRRLLTYLYRAIFLPDEQWSAGQSSPKVLLNADQRASLEVLAEALEGRTKTPDLDGDRLNQIVDLLEEARDLVEQIDLPDETARLHLLWRISEAERFASDIDRYGNAVVVDTLVDVIREGQDFSKREDLSEPQASRLRWLLGQIFLNGAGNAVFFASIQAAAHVPELVAATTQAIN